MRVPNLERPNRTQLRGALEADPVEPMAGDAELRITVSSLARRLGVASSTLRTWDRRYGVGPSEHVTGSHRRYNRRDVERLETMQRALADGAAPAEAARFAINVFATQRSDSGSENGLGGFVNSLKTAGSVSTRPTRNRELASAFLSCDVITLDRILADSIRHIGIAQTWRSVVAPFLSWIEVAPVSGSARTTGSRILTYSLNSVFARAMVEAPVPNATAVSVLLAPLPGRPLDLELRALAAAVAQEAIAVRLLPTPVASSALVAGIGLAEADVVVLWAQDVDTDVLPLLRAIRKRRTGLRIMLGGHDCCNESLPRTVRNIGGMSSALDAVVAAVG